jgi:hypothetical protein
VGAYFWPPNGPGIELPARECTTSRLPAAGESSRVPHRARVRRPAAGSLGRPSGRPVSSNALLGGSLSLPPAPSETQGPRVDIEQANGLGWDRWKWAGGLYDPNSVVCELLTGGADHYDVR